MGKRQQASHGTPLLKARLAVSITEAASVVGIGRTSMYREIERGTISTVRIGGRRLITIDELRRYVAALEPNERPR